jgi:hypothetical protein
LQGPGHNTPAALTPDRNRTPLGTNGYCGIATAAADPDVVSARSTCTSESCDLLIADVGSMDRPVKPVWNRPSAAKADSGNR